MVKDPFMKRIIILGGSSFIGLPIMRELTKNKEWNVVGTYHNNRPEEKLQFEELNVLDEKKVLAFLQEVKPLVIIHCAAMSNVDECQKNLEQCYRYNVSSVKTVVQYCHQNHMVKYIFFSSSEVFDGAKGTPYVETDLCSSLSYYGQYKLEAEKLVASLPNSAIIRPCLVYGLPKNHQHRNIFNHIYKSLREGKEFTAYDDMMRSPTYVEDIPMVVERIIKKDKIGIFHTGGEAVSIYDFALKVAEVFNFDKNGIVQKSSLGNEVTYKPRNGALDSSFTQQDLGIEFRSINEALHSMRGALS